MLDHESRRKISILMNDISTPYCPSSQWFYRLLQFHVWGDFLLHSFLCMSLGVLMPFQNRYLGHLSKVLVSFSSLEHYLYSTFVLDSLVLWLSSCYCLELEFETLSLRVFYYLLNHTDPDWIAFPKNSNQVYHQLLNVRGWYYRYLLIHFCICLTVITVVEVKEFLELKWTSSISSSSFTSP